MITYLILVALFILGSGIGSFTSVVIYRLHSQKKGIIRGRSLCPHCNKQLKPLDLVPIFSYLSLRGKCRYCNKEISYMYPLIELVTGGLFVLLFFLFPFADSILNFSTVQLALYGLYAFYTFVLVFSFFFDLHYMKVSDEILLPAILIGLIATIGYPQTPHIFDALIGAAIPLAFFSLQILVSKGKWIGAGDLRIGAFMGIILGWQMVILALFLSYLLGSVAGILVALKKGQLRGVKIPFAPLLVSGTFLTIFFGNDLLSWYLRGIGL